MDDDESPSTNLLIHIFKHSCLANQNAFVIVFGFAARVLVNSLDIF